MARRLVFVIIAAVVSAALPALTAAQTLATYDNFNVPRIDPIKWRGLEQTTSTAVSNTEIFRRIVGDKLQLALTSYGATTSDAGFTGDGRNRLLINHAALVDGTPRITVLQANVIVNAATAQDCAGSDSASRARAQLIGFFFNDGTGSDDVGDVTGNIAAGIHLQRDARSGDSIVGFMVRCTNTTCTSTTLLKSVVFERTWTVRVPETLTVKWQPGNDRFAFTAKAGDNTETRVLTYDDIPVSDSVDAKGFLKDLRATTSVVNCTARPTRASIDARFDNVKINATAVNALGD